MGVKVEGLVTKSIGNVCHIRTQDGHTHTVLVKGSFKLRGIRSTTPVTVGDRVIAEVPSDADGDKPGWIVEILPRQNYIIRKASNLSKESHILGANLDRTVLIVTVNFPVTTTTFIDRYLSTAEAYKVPVTLVFNKIDRYREEEKRELTKLFRLYREIGYTCFAVSAITQEGFEEIAEHLARGITLLSGHSGVGKSTFVNTLVPGLGLRTGEISEAHQTGVHTTTHSEMIPYRDGYLIDTPGIKGFGTIEFEKKKVGHYFSEIFEFGRECHFSDCTHTHEPKCNVLRALHEGKIARSRYNSYLSIFFDDEEEKYRAEY